MGERHHDRPTCCWTHCDNEQGIGTWTEINGETLPICEDHWYGNLDNERRKLREALDDLNRLRSNIVATQSASWSNTMYPLVAILDRAGFELVEDVSPQDMADHMLCYGGAGGSPAHPLPDTRRGDLWKQRYDEAVERGTALQRLHSRPGTGASTEAVDAS